MKHALVQNKILARSPEVFDTVHTVWLSKTRFVVPTSFQYLPSQITPLRRKGCVLQREKQLRSELVQLIEKQIEMLAKESCVGLTEAELREYGDRKERIDELHDTLDHLDVAA
jgi:hypothetical protein